MDSQTKEVLSLLKTIYENNLHEHVVLIGSWAEYMYSATGLLPDYDAKLKTLDIDFLIKNLRKPRESVNLIELAKDLGYKSDTDRLTGITKLVGVNEFEIEFLINKRGQGIEDSLKTNLGVTAQALRHLSILSDNSVEVEYFGIKCIIPIPEAFFLHKIIINSQRGDKAEKDRAVINEIYHYLDYEKIDELIRHLTKKERKEVDNYYKTYIIPMIENERKIKEAQEKLKSVINKIK